MNINFDNLDTLIKSGKANLAANLLLKFNKTQQQIPRQDRLILAKLARRAFIPQIGIKLLRPLVRPSDKKIIVPTDLEKVEYAANLSWLGALSECHALLDEVDLSKTPEALFIRGLALFREWRYSEAIPFLKNYSERMDVEAYWRSIGKLNLMAAYAHEGLSTENLGLELEEIGRRDQIRIILANVFLFQTESYVKREEWGLAQRSIEAANRQLDQGGMNSLFLNKWKAVVEMKKNLSKGKKSLEEVRKEAILVKDWETLRDCDHQEIRFTRDKKIGLHLYFGTPHAAYRDHLLKDCPWLTSELGSFYDLSFGQAEKPIIPWEETREGHVLQKLWEILQSDFYGPFSAGTLQSKLFPEKHFSLDRGSNSLHQALKRLRAFFLDQKIPLSIKESGSEYKLEAHAPVTLRVRIADIHSPKIYSTTLQELKNHFEGRRFRARDVSYKLDLSRNRVLEYLRLWQEQGFVERSGTGPSTTYRLKTLPSQIGCRWISIPRISRPYF